MESFVDHYKIMRVHMTASDVEIRKSYQNLSRKFHPDKNKSPDATAIFQTIGESYSILKDVEQRAAYDEAYKYLMGGKIKKDKTPANRGAENSSPKDSKNSKAEHGRDETKPSYSDARSGPPPSRSSAEERLRQDYGIRRRGPELRPDLSAVYEVRGKSPPNTPWPRNAESSKPTSSPRTPLTPETFIPPVPGRRPADLDISAKIFLSWKNKQLAALSQRFERWIDWSGDCKYKIKMLRDLGESLQLKLNSLEEIERVRIDLFMKVGQLGSRFNTYQEATHQALLRTQTFQLLANEKSEAEKQLKVTNQSIADLMSKFSDKQYDFDRADHMALLAFAGKTLDDFDQYYPVSQLRYSDVEESKGQWVRLQRMGYPIYQMYDTPGEILKACVSALHHDLKPDHENREDLRVCRRCNKDIPINVDVSKCRKCHASMCSACSDKAQLLKDYYEWLQDEKMTDSVLFGV